MASLAALALLATFAAVPPGSPPPDLRDFEVMQFIVANGSEPAQILRLDDNGTIARACVTPCTRDALRAAGVAATESQIALLKAWRLVDERDDRTLVTRVAIVAPPATDRLRATSRRAADALVERLSAPLDAFRAQLGTVKRPNTAYTMLFSYVLDDLVWREWERGGLVGKRELTVKTPFWSGVVWAIAPRRAFSMGTNTIDERGVDLKVNWTEAAIPGWGRSSPTSPRSRASSRTTSPGARWWSRAGGSRSTGPPAPSPARSRGRCHGSSISTPWRGTSARGAARPPW
jgi:hypothetical protein